MRRRGRGPEWTDGTAAVFPLLRAKGTPRDIGFAVGRRLGGEIRAVLGRRGKWWAALREFADAQPPGVLETFEAAAAKHAPSVLEEIRGLAEGSELPYRELLVFNLQPEYGALMDAAARPAPAGEPPGARSPGCSTIVVAGGARLIVAHNEDGNGAWRGSMALLDARPDGKPRFLALLYPGIVAGNGPWVNGEGVLMTTNFIYAREVRTGVGRYLLDRLAMEASSADAALAVCRHPERAYAAHHVVASFSAKRATSIEVTAGDEVSTKIEGVFLHANHLVFPALAATPQNEEYVGKSSVPRMKVLERWRAASGPAASVSEARLLDALSSHEGRPWSPCRHPEGEATGATLCCSVFDLGARTWRLSKDQPCLGRFTGYDVKEIV